MTEKSDDDLFEWDAARNIINIHKHGIAFQEAIGIFKDQNRLEFFDGNHSTGEEQRYITLGRLPEKMIIVLVVSTDRQCCTRIISARYASKREESFTMTDKNIDFSDIPELTDEYLSTLKKVEPRKFYKVVPVKEPCHILIDKDVLDFFGKGRERIPDQNQSCFTGIHE